MPRRQVKVCGRQSSRAVQLPPDYREANKATFVSPEVQFTIPDWCA